MARRVKVGRPRLSENERRVRVNVMLAPDVLEALERVENRSAYIERLIRTDLGIESVPLRTDD